LKVRFCFQIRPPLFSSTSAIECRLQ
jgi:hypothetical protein